MGKTGKLLALLGGLLAIALGIRYAITAFSSPDDQTLIRQALDESIKASREGRPGGVMELLSRDLRVNEMPVNVNTQVLQFIRDSKPNVRLENDEAIIAGNEAKIVSPVQVDVKFLAVSRTVHLNEVTLTFHKEEAREWLIIPTKKWRLTKVEAPPSSLYELLQ